MISSSEKMRLIVWSKLGLGKFHYILFLKMFTIYAFLMLGLMRKLLMT